VDNPSASSSTSIVARRTPTASDADDTVAPLTASMSRLRRSGSCAVLPWNCLRKRASRDLVAARLAVLHDLHAFHSPARDSRVAK
jgi:hypothetical protein